MNVEGLDRVVPMHSWMSVPSVIELGVSGHPICNFKNLECFGREDRSVMLRKGSPGCHFESGLNFK